MKVIGTMLLAGAVAVLSLGCGGGGATAEVIPTCEGRGDEYFAGMAKTSSDGKVTMALTSAEPAPPANSYTNRWTLLVTDATALATLPGADVVAAPYMVDHGHGAPNVIATDMGDGVYLIDPLSLKMTGLWDVTMKVIPSGGDESRVVFSFCVQPL
jgi:YtkA-like